MSNFLAFMLLFIFFMLLLFNQYLYNEKFKNYLFPTKGLGNECTKENLKPAYMPMSCIIDGKLKPFTNCKCVDSNGICKKCYGVIKKDKNRPIRYNPDEFNDNKDELNKRINTYINEEIN